MVSVLYVESQLMFSTKDDSSVHIETNDFSSSTLKRVIDLHSSKCQVLKYPSIRELLDNTVNKDILHISFSSYDKLKNYVTVQQDKINLFCVPFKDNVKLDTISQYELRLDNRIKTVILDSSSVSEEMIVNILNSGVENVIASLTPVDTKASVIFFETFYKFMCTLNDLRESINKSFEYMLQETGYDPSEYQYFLYTSYNADNIFSKDENIGFTAEEKNLHDLL